MKLVINACFGGFGLSPDAYRWLAEKRGVECHFHKWSGGRIGDTVPIRDGEPMGIFWHAKDQHGNHIDDMREDRSNPLLVELVETLGDKASGQCASLKVVEVPDDIRVEIDEYDGNETVREKHRSWS